MKKNIIKSFFIVLIVIFVRSSYVYGVTNNTSNLEQDDESSSWVTDFLEHPIKTGVKFFMIGVCDLADAIQLGLNEMQTSMDYTSQDEKILYSYDELKQDANGEDISKNSTDETKKGIGNRDKYTKVGGYSKGSGIEVTVDDENYTKKTKIPVVVGDFYNLATGKIDFLDDNFLTGNTEKKDGELIHKTNSVWNKIRNPMVEIIKISIYVSSAILIIILIWFAIGIVRTGTQNPAQRAEYKKGLESFAKSLFMLITTVLIMALCIFGTRAILNALGQNGDYQLPVRVRVKGAYSFSTNFTGYMRYMAQIDDVKYAFQKAGYSMMYLIFVIFNVLIEAIMIIRILALWFLSIIGPLIAANYAIRKTGMRQYNVWLFMYISLSVMQVVIYFVCQVLYKIADFV